MAEQASVQHDPQRGAYKRTAIVRVEDVAVGGAFTSRYELEAAFAALLIEREGYKAIIDAQAAELARLRSGEAAARIVQTWDRDKYDDTTVLDTHSRAEL